MALFIPSRRKAMKPDVSLDRPPSQMATDHPKGWNQLRLRDALQRLERGEWGRFDEKQVIRIREIIELTAGADGDLSVAQTRAAIRQIEENRVSLGLDKGRTERLTTFLAEGPIDEHQP